MDDDTSTEGTVKAELIASLKKLQDAIVWKLEGLSEYDLRRPLTPTGTNLLGMVKHLASVQAGYFGDCLDRPWPHPMPWFEDGAPLNADMFATPEESAAWVLSFYADSWTHAEGTFAATSLTDTGTVPWWPPERRHPTLFTLLLHMTVETARHAGHVDIVRELIDGQAGRFTGDQSLPDADEIDWPAYVATVDAAARAATPSSPRYR